MRAAALAVAVVAAFVGVMYLRFASDSVPGPPPGAVAGGPQCIVFRTASDGDVNGPPRTCAPTTGLPTPEPYPSPAENKLSTPKPEPSPPAILNGMKVMPLEVGAPADLPSDVALILETGCWGCEGGPRGLVRTYLRPDGSIAYDSLLDAAALGLHTDKFTAPDGSIREYQPFITGYATTPDASLIVASICTRATCAPQGLSDWSAESQTALVRSSNGGVTWTEIQRLEVGATIFGLLPTGEILLITYDSRDSTLPRVYPGLSELQLAPGVGYWGVKVLANGELILRNDSSIPVLRDGRPFVSGLTAAEPGSINDLLIDPNRMHGLASVNSFSPGSPGNYYLLPFDSAGAIGRGPFASAGENVVWRTDNYLRLGPDLTGEGLILANATLPITQLAQTPQAFISGFVPVVLDLKQGTIQPIRPFFDGALPSSRNLIAAVQRGPFARVVNADATCVNVRAEPLSSAGILDCAAEGVLLRNTGEAGGPAGEWLKVVTPNGAEGWANAQYLQR